VRSVEQYPGVAHSLRLWSAAVYDLHLLLRQHCSQILRVELMEFRGASVALNQDRDFHGLAGVACAHLERVWLRLRVVRVDLVHALAYVGFQVASGHIGCHFCGHRKSG